MKLFGVLIAACAAASWSVVHKPESLRLGQDVLDADELMALHSVVTGQAPSSTVDTKVLESFNAFQPIEKAVLVIVPTLEEGSQSMNGDLAAPAIEMTYPSDAVAVAGTDEKVTVASVNSNVPDHIEALSKSLSATHGDNYLLTLVAQTGVENSNTAGRQILQTTETNLFSTKPRNADFGVIFIIVAAFLVAMIFGLVFISYELGTMGPGDNIAYKLGAAATKKNQEWRIYL